MARSPVVIRGLDELKKELDGLPAKLQKNVIQSGNRAVAKAIVDEVKAQGGSLPDTVIRAVTSGPSRFSDKKRRGGFIVGLRAPFSSMSHWFEYGTGPRFQETTGRYTGRMTATPWLRPALESIGARAEEIWAKAASRNFERQLKKINK